MTTTVTVLSFAEPHHSTLRPEWQQVYVDDRRVEVLALGDGAPLLFLHGWGLSPRAYLPALRALADRGLRITAPSLPGFGRSDARRNRDHSLNGVADHLIDALDALALPDALPVVAHSLGAGVSLRIAALRPDLISRLTLIGPVGGAAHGPAPWPALLTGILDDARARVPVAGLGDFLAAALRHPIAITASGLAARAADSVTDLQAAVAAGIPVRLVFAAADHVVRPGDLPTCAPGITTEMVCGRHGWPLGEPRRFADLVMTSLIRWRSPHGRTLESEDRPPVPLRWGDRLLSIRRLPVEDLPGWPQRCRSRRSYCRVATASRAQRCRRPAPTRPISR